MKTGDILRDYWETPFRVTVEARNVSSRGEVEYVARLRLLPGAKERDSDS